MSTFGSLLRSISSVAFVQWQPRESPNTIFGSTLFAAPPRCTTDESGAKPARRGVGVGSNRYDAFHLPLI